MEIISQRIGLNSLELTVLGLRCSIVETFPLVTAISLSPSFTGRNVSNSKNGSAASKENVRD
ncbi:hypothetical protein BES34_000850 [Leptospira inadai serovar Lyme]|uniref:Uncharacterized protein n=1 Tax=Leptospira inadai serovar Lyme TaxID=293084 RepID=A0ABX4YNK2_9LEPT|nr:hypothetical protein BES34_000850 [Leptospira inadai serovar Lyme]